MKTDLTPCNGMSGLFGYRIVLIISFMLDKAGRGNELAVEMQLLCGSLFI